MRSDVASRHAPDARPSSLPPRTHDRRVERHNLMHDVDSHDVSWLPADGHRFNLDQPRRDESDLDHATGRHLAREELTIDLGSAVWRWRMPHHPTAFRRVSSSAT